MTRDVVAREVVLAEQLADLELDQVQQLGIVDQVDLVQEDHDGGHVDLAGEQDVLAGLGHGAVSRGDDQDGPVHLGGAGDHVLDVVGVAWAVHVGVVAILGLVLDVGSGDGQNLGIVAAAVLLRGLGDLIVTTVIGQALCPPGPW